MYIFREERGKNMRQFKKLIVFFTMMAMVIPMCSQENAIAAKKATCKTKKMVLVVGEKKTITVSGKKKNCKYSFKSKKASIAKVSNKGVVLAKKKGTTKVQVKETKKSGNKKSRILANIKVTVKNKANVKVNPTAAPVQTATAVPTKAPVATPTVTPKTTPVVTATPTVTPTVEPTQTPMETSKPKSFIDDDYSEPDDFFGEEDGVTYGQVEAISYYSTIANQNRRAKVLLPPNYDSNKKYPVLYLLHGIGGSENEWLNCGHPVEIIGNLIAHGQAKEMIVVFPDECVQRVDEDDPKNMSVEQFAMYDRMKDDMDTSLMPYIDSHYSTLPGRDNRAVAGLSMGGRNAIYIGVSMVDKFAYMGAFCPAVGVLPYETEDGLLTTETLTIPQEYRDTTLFMILAGDNDSVVHDNPKLYSDTLTANGVNHIFYNWPGGHGWGPWKNGLYNFARRIFQ